MGSALAIPLSDHDVNIRLWGTEFDTDILRELEEGRQHPRIGAKMPDDVTYFSPAELEASLENTDVVILGVNSRGLPPVMNKALPYLNNDQVLFSITKGFVEIDQSAYPPGEGIQRLLEESFSDPEQAPGVIQVAGPSIAAELANRSHTAVVFASEDPEEAKTCRNLFRTSYYGVEVTDDFRGVDFCLALKNLYSISLAWPGGLAERSQAGTRSNLRAILFLQALEELQTILNSFGGNPETVHGLAALGDFVTTSETGRNGRFGVLLGKGKTPDEAYEFLQEQGVGTVEGYEIAEAGRSYLRGGKGNQSFNLEKTPLLQGIFSVLLDGESVRGALQFLD